MPRRALSLLFRLGLLGVLAASLSGCWLKMILGNVIVVHTLPDEVDAVLTTVFANASATVCNVEPPFAECTYIIDGEVVNSSSQIIAEGGVFGGLFDPLILEVPSNVTSPTGTYDTGSGPQALPISRGNSFPVVPGYRITAEVGTTFLFLDLPANVTSGLPGGDPHAGPVFSYTLSFTQVVSAGPPTPAVTVKPLMAGVVTVLWQRYYIPLFPCIPYTDTNPFAAIPAITIPVDDSPEGLETDLGDLIRNHNVSPCNNQLYDFSAALPPPGLVFLPLVRR